MKRLKLLQNGSRVANKTNAHQQINQRQPFAFLFTCRRVDVTRGRASGNPGSQAGDCRRPSGSVAVGCARTKDPSGLFISASVLRQSPSADVTGKNRRKLKRKDYANDENVLKLSNGRCAAEASTEELPRPPLPKDARPAGRAESWHTSLSGHLKHICEMKRLKLLQNGSRVANKTNAHQQINQRQPFAFLFTCRRVDVTRGRASGILGVRQGTAAGPPVPLLLGAPAQRT
ncbi:hypothetical protein SKAU_G00277450 [Synaphobranchus kaupii]|uniref:Uncharacterized protein n=1 Tax=Synaphobranchus kaupii TaxID=118154 RepID=A0A9Q1IMN9_SYNKA|nr:hypothetical protein SKAU_G00277450 [Synaphobranchus kaupii]